MITTSAPAVVGRELVRVAVLLALAVLGIIVLLPNLLALAAAAAR